MVDGPFMSEEDVFGNQDEQTIQVGEWEPLEGWPVEPTNFAKQETRKNKKQNVVKPVSKKEPVALPRSTELIPDADSPEKDPISDPKILIKVPKNETLMKEFGSQREQAVAYQVVNIVNQIYGELAMKAEAAQNSEDLGQSKEVLEGVVKMFQKISKGSKKTLDRMKEELQTIEELDANSKVLL